MTLFAHISDDDVFDKVLDKYFNGHKDLITIAICEGSL